MLQISVVLTILYIYNFKSDIIEGVWFICSEYEYRGDFYSVGNADCFFFIWNILDATKYDAWSCAQFLIKVFLTIWSAELWKFASVFALMAFSSAHYVTEDMPR